MDFAHDDPYAKPEPGSAADLPRVMFCIQLGFQRCRPLIAPFVLLMLAQLFVSQGPSSLGQLLSAVFADLEMYELVAVPALGMLCCLLPQMAVAFALGALQTGLYRVMRVSLVEGVSAVEGLGGAFHPATARFAWVLLTAVVGTILSFMLCCLVLPGLVVMAFMAIALYFVATMDEPWDRCIARSAAIVVPNLLPLLVVGGTLFLVVLVFSVGTGCIAGGLGTFLGTFIAAATGLQTVQALVSNVLCPVLNALFSAAVGFVAWVIWGATLVAIDTADAGVALARD